MFVCVQQGTYILNFSQFMQSFNQSVQPSMSFFLSVYKNNKLLRIESQRIEHRNRNSKYTNLTLIECISIDLSSIFGSIVNLKCKCSINKTKWFIPWLIAWSYEDGTKLSVLVDRSFAFFVWACARSKYHALKKIIVITKINVTWFVCSFRNV